MPNMDNFTADLTINKQNDTVVSLNTQQKYVPQNIQLTIDVRAASGLLATTADTTVDITAATSGGTNVSGLFGTKSSTEPSSGYFAHLNTTAEGAFNVTQEGWLATSVIAPSEADIDVYLPVAEASASVSGSNTVTPYSSISGTNVTLSNVDNGIEMTASGGGTASASVAVNVSQAGYIPTGAGSAQTISAAQNLTSSSSFISGVTLNAPTSGTRSFTVTVPNGDSTQTITFTVDSSRNVTIS